MSVPKLLYPLRSLLRPFKGLITILFGWEADMASTWASAAHARLGTAQWGIFPLPEFADHDVDLHLWHKTRNPLFLERGVFSSLCLKGGNVLELACGDGFNARNFYSLRSKHVTACDYNPDAIGHAINRHSAPNITYVLADIRKDFPGGGFDNVIWDAAIEHFSRGEIAQILHAIKNRLTSTGILSGYTLVENVEDRRFVHHQTEFRSKEDLLAVLVPHFVNVTVFETIYPTRHNLYFWASDGPLPLMEGWAHVTHHRSPPHPQFDPAFTFTGT